MFRSFDSYFIDFLSICSIVGIWPRYIEPRLLKKTFLNFSLPNADLKGLKILHFTDLHFHASFSPTFLKKIQRQIQKEKPDLIFFTGDFLCYSQLEKKEELKNFLKSLQAPLGCFCVLGNHDYASYVTRNEKGDYVTKKPISPLSGLFSGLKTIVSRKKKSNATISQEAKEARFHEELCSLLKETPFQLLENSSQFLPCGLNIVGLGEYALNRALPEQAFTNYNPDYPGIVLIHNPDAFSLIKHYPGDLVLAGHTHGEQIHIPFLKKISKKLTRLENPEYTRGLYHLFTKQLYVNRGVGGHKPFRFCSPPELLVINII